MLCVCVVSFVVAVFESFFIGDFIGELNACLLSSVRSLLLLCVVVVVASAFHI